MVLNSNRCLSTTTINDRSSYPVRMSPKNHPILYAGLDVAKRSLPLHLAGRFYHLSNHAKGHAQLLKRVRSLSEVHVVCEATGGYEQPVVRALQAANIPVSIVEAGRVRYFARAQGRRAKTDPMDAAVLTPYGGTFHPRVTPPTSPQPQRLADWSQRRRQRIHTLTVETNRAEHHADAFCQRQARPLRRLLAKPIEPCNQAITQLIAADVVLAHKARRLDAIPGVGPVVAATVLAEMPERGSLNRQTAAALAGVAPYHRDSGAQNGIRRISGGRRPVRCALYMATWSAIRHDRILISACGPPERDRSSPSPPVCANSSSS